MTKLTNRQKAKARTRAKMITKARDLFATRDYHAVTIRDIAKAMRMTTGAIFGHFSGKAELFEAALGFAPPVDGPLTRAAPMLLSAMLDLLEPYNEGSDNNWDGQMKFRLEEAERAIALATSPLDGEAWARHLSAIRRDEPHTLAAGEPAASVPSGAAGDQ